MSKRSTLIVTAVLALALVGAACGGDDDDSAGDGGDNAPAAQPADSTVEVTAVDFSTGLVTITNTTDAEVDLAGHWLCNRPVYLELPSETLEPGASIDVELGGLTPGSGEVGVYTSDNFANSADMVSYVTWGGGGGRQSVAESAGVWAGDPAAEPTGNLTLTGEPGSAAGWAG